ncbi:MAG: redoxin domain-containing protein [Pyrinomonadaceae bacterium]
MRELFPKSSIRPGSIIPWAFAGIGCWLSYTLFQHGRRLSKHLSLLEQQLNQKNAFPVSELEIPRELSVGSPAPDFELPDVQGKRQNLSQWRGRRILLIFFDSECVFCTEMTSSLTSLSSDSSDGRPVAIIVATGEVEKNRQFVIEHGIKCPVLLQEQSEVMLKYRVPGTPAGYLIDEDGCIASEQLLGAQAILHQAGSSDYSYLKEPIGDRQLSVADGNQIPSKAQRGNLPLVESHIARHGLAKGEIAPLFNLPRLDGEDLSLAEYRGRMILLVFSDPECGPCNQLAPRLEKLARRTPDIQIIMVSRGSVEANNEKVLEHGLTFPVVRQRHWEISRLYAMFATPIAYLIDEGGLIVANLAIGVEPILNLLISAAVMSLLKETKASSDASAEGGTETGESVLMQSESRA